MSATTSAAEKQNEDGDNTNKALKSLDWTIVNQCWRHDEFTDVVKQQHADKSISICVLFRRCDWRDAHGVSHRREWRLRV
jgi:hypothetical protein